MGNISWQTYEFENKKRHRDWVWYAGLIFAISAVIAFFYHNLFFGIFLIIAGISIIMYSLRRPKLLEITLDDDTIMINSNRIKYDNIKQFWIDETEKPDKLLLLVKSSFVPILVIPLAEVQAQAVRSKLLLHLPEVLIRESTGAKIADRLGF